MKPLSKLHAEAVAKAKTDDEKVKAAAVAMIETPMEMIRAILLKHEQAVIEVMKELSEERDRAFDLLRRADEREETNRRANASWTLMCEKMVAAEREACAKVCEEPGWNAANWCAKAIRARSKA